MHQWADKQAPKAAPKEGSLDLQTDNSGQVGGFNYEGALVPLKLAELSIFGDVGGSDNIADCYSCRVLPNPERRRGEKRTRIPSKEF